MCRQLSRAEIAIAKAEAERLLPSEGDRAQTAPVIITTLRLVASVEARDAAIVQLTRGILRRQKELEVLVEFELAVRRSGHNAGALKALDEARKTFR